MNLSRAILPSCVNHFWIMRLHRQRAPSMLNLGGIGTLKSIMYNVSETQNMVAMPSVMGTALVDTYTISGTFRRRSSSAVHFSSVLASRSRLREHHLAISIVHGARCCMATLSSTLQSQLWLNYTRLWHMVAKYDFSNTHRSACLSTSVNSARTPF